MNVFDRAAVVKAVLGELADLRYGGGGGEAR
eukprot:CAMPEP_0202438840 /NCGR_PEP_ID=MMETSP1345-20130828/35411_1 /ASSEMBLY_ACC=CAM_ASM_000843 /TAXON_ID=342563 /ORGANISM="Fabrea Fabrea salina" /LENGTH=30 /DNA_ID= /DNA_START= /DNA_END= /DNA_ORIENTATION=